MPFKTRLLPLLRALPALRRQVFSVSAGIAEILFPCALVLSALSYTDVLRTEGTRTLLSLIDSLLATPLAVAMISYSASSCWEGRRPSLAGAVQLVRIRMRKVLMTGLVAGGVTFFLSWLATAFSSLVGILPALLGWLPVAGGVVSAAAAVVIWFVSLLLQFAGHLLLVLGMLPLTADGMSGRMQLTRALQLMRGGRESIPALTLIFLLWAVVLGLHSLIAPVFPVIGLLPGLLSAFSAAAVSVVYLMERDRQEGPHFTV